MAMLGAIKGIAAHRWHILNRRVQT